MSHALKTHLTTQVRDRIAPEIARQQKYIVIAEVVRLVFDDHVALGISIVPAAENPEAHYFRKSDLTRMLQSRYQSFTNDFVSVGDVVTDLLAIASEYQIEILMPCEA